ncbi:Tat proofreading chaperone FdhE [Cricetibacter osteomyelitidis]|uniref:Protein FdhE homolog n=1 Tax=Cricetibacter osteomyelitidis TaxID=1521931 RepID=A0A4R2T3N8_9PAST|nr:formate dehydrogenase accessory protein FdhE [Cricetibacter osteomyelitidis]TCP96890.1 Tat proofreading chaperone FdhE [Cricetibacter osteomyelitidis]
MSIRILPESEIVKNAGELSSPPLLFANPKNLYQRRAERLRKLAENSPLADYLLFSAQIADAQLKVLNDIKFTQQLDAVQLSDEFPLNAKTWQRNPIWLEILTALLVEVKPHANEQAQQTIEWLEKAASSEINALADKLLAQDYRAVGSDKALFIWAALSLYWLQLAQQLPRNAKAESGEQLHVCPVCGTAPTASVIHFGSTQGLRYLHCALCESEWNMVRSKCSNCDQSGKVEYWSLDSENAPVKAESCGDCHSYLKVVYQEKDPYVEPIADDLATLFLDMEMEQKEFFRSGINPFLFPGE